MVGDRRGISTVMDVSLALLVISATVLLIGLYLYGDDRSIDAERGDQAIQTLSGSTVTITYNVSTPNESGHAATDSENYDLPENLDPAETGELYEITTYGSAMDLLGEAALTSLTIDGTDLFAYSDDVERSVEGATQSRLVGSEGSIYAVGTWEPYRGAAINATASAGTPPPSTTDVSSASDTVSGNVPAVDSEHLAATFVAGEERSPADSTIQDGFDPVGEEIAAAMVEGYFPPEQTQYTLESSLSDNAITLYNYRQLGDAVGVDLEDAITGPDANAERANERLVHGTSRDDEALAAIVAEDLRNSPAGGEIRDTYEGFGTDVTSADEAELAATFDREVAPETIDITVQTWDE